MLAVFVLTEFERVVDGALFGILLMDQKMKMNEEIVRHIIHHPVVILSPC